jgi:ATP-binding cassette, subfamily B, bacterial
MVEASEKTDAGAADAAARRRKKRVERRRSTLVMATAAFRASPLKATVSVTLEFLTQLTLPLSAWALGRLTDAALSGGGLIVPASILAASAAGMFVMWQANFQLRTQVEEITSHYVDRQIAEMAAGLPGLEHHERPEFIDRIDHLRNEFWLYSMSVQALLETAATVVQVAATLLLLSRIDPLLWLVPVAALPGFWASAKGETFRLKIGEERPPIMRRMDWILRMVREAPSAKELRVFGIGDRLVGLFRQDVRDLAALEVRYRLPGAKWLLASRCLLAVGYAMALVLVAVRATAGDITVGDTLIAVALANQVMEAARAASSRSAWLAWTLTAVRHYVWLLDYASETRERGLGEGEPAPERINNDIKFEDVSFRYPATERDVLAGVDLTIPAGSIVAVVGDNGAGKSTLMKLLCRFYDPTGGRITCDGVDLRRFDVEDWRRRASAAFQDHARFELMAGEAVGIGDLPRLDDEPVVVGAVDKAAANDVFDALPDGLASQLGPQWEDGIDLSGGQWQKVALARGMMRDEPLLLVLDEPTAALDADAEHALFERYSEAARRSAARNGAITLLVSHRFSTVRMADLIVVIGDGRIVETGTHEQLMAARSTYAELYEMQARAYR